MFRKLFFLSIAIINSIECIAGTSINEEQQNICNLINCGKLIEAKSATDKMMTDFSNNNDLPEMIYWTIRHCEWKSNFDEAKRLYQIMIQQYPNNSHQNQMQIGIARCEIMQMVISQNYDSAKTDINSMALNFAGNTDLAESLFMIAERFEWQLQFEEEKGVFEIIINNFPTGAFADKAKIGIARAGILSFISAKDYAKFNSSLDQLFINYTDNPELAQTAIIIGEWFYKDKSSSDPNENLNKAIIVWERVINELPNSQLAPEACCWAGDCFQKLGNYDDSIRIFQKVADQYSNYKYAWHAQFEIGRNYEKMNDLGLISKSESDIMIKSAYQRLLEKYPACPVAQTAQEWITAHTSE